MALNRYIMVTRFCHFAASESSTSSRSSSDLHREVFCDRNIQAFLDLLLISVCLFDSKGGKARSDKLNLNFKTVKLPFTGATKKFDQILIITFICELAHLLFLCIYSNINLPGIVIDV